MANSYFIIPDTGTIVYNGDTVMLSEYPGILAIAAYGWYKHNQSSEMGWHFVLLTNKEVVPSADVNLSLLTVVSSNPNKPDHPCPVPPPFLPSKFEDRTFITLDSIAQRDKLLTTFMPNGRIVRINDIGNGQPGYFQWGTMSQTWSEWDVTENSTKLIHADNLESVDGAEYTKESIQFVFHATSPLCEELGVLEHAECELCYRAPYQIITIVSTQETFIRQVYQITPQWLASDWFESKNQQKITALQAQVDEMSECIETWKENDNLENVLTGALRLSNAELNVILEARLNGETG